MGDKTIAVTLSIGIWFSVLSISVPAENADAAPLCHRGAYQLSDGTELVVQPSDADNLRYRLLDGRTGKLFPVTEGRYESGLGWSVRDPRYLTATFGACEEGKITFHIEKGSRLEGRRVQLPTTPITFSSGDLELYGELVMPRGGRPEALVVLQYGSGPKRKPCTGLHCR